MADLRDRAALEAEFERQIGNLTASQRRRLEELLGNPPDPANVPESFWQDVERERRQKLALLLLVLFLAGARQHGAGDRRAVAGGTSGSTDGTSSSPAGDAAVAAAAKAWSEARAAELARDYVTVSREKLGERAIEWRERKRLADASELGAGLAPPKPPGAADAKAAAAEILSPVRDQNAAITETTNAGSSGSEWAVKAMGLDSPDDRWQVDEAGNVCPICRPLNGQPRAVWEPKFPKGPPCHVRCACWIEYARDLKGATAAA